jgi:hypothetical protein
LGRTANVAEHLYLNVVVRVLESEALAIPESQCDAVAEGVEKVVLTAASSIANAKAKEFSGL